MKGLNYNRERRGREEDWDLGLRRENSRESGDGLEVNLLLWRARECNRHDNLHKAFDDVVAIVILVEVSSKAILCHCVTLAVALLFFHGFFIQCCRQTEIIVIRCRFTWNTWIQIFKQIFMLKKILEILKVYIKLPKNTLVFHR